MIYKILEGDTDYQLEDEVNKHLEKGWQLVGGVSYSMSMSSDKYVQAVQREIK